MSHPLLRAAPAPARLSLAALADLARQTDTAAARLTLKQPSRPAGHARLDAFGNIFNEVLVVGLNEKANARPPDAPVSYPFLWDTPQHDKVQWNGSAPTSSGRP